MEKNTSDEKDIPKSKERIKWWKEDQVVEIDTNNILIIEDIHMDAKNINYFGMLRNIQDYKDLTPIVIRPIEENKYALVMGMKIFTAAKIMNRNKIKAVIVEKYHKEMMHYINSLKDDTSNS